MDTKQKEISQKKTEIQAQTQWALIWRKFKKHKLAMSGLFILIILYIIGVAMPGFFAPYGKTERFNNKYLPPQKIRFIDDEGNFHLRPFVYNMKQEMNLETWQQVTVPDTSKKYYIQFFVRGTEYKLMSLFKTNIHLFGVEKGGTLFLLGTNILGQDLFSRIIYSCRVSLVIGLIGVFLSMVFGLIFGGISGLSGGIIDDIIQRIIEILMSIPKLPLWMAFAAAVPEDWSPLQVYFAITVILSTVGWTGLARVTRSKFLSLRETDFVTAAYGYNTPTTRIIFKHLIPNFISYILVRLTLAIPGMILAETSLSFLGIGLRPPVVSLGVLLKDAQNFQTVSLHPWLLFPGVMVIIVVLAYNFVGDGLRDAADPYQ